ncbi:MULTISPECIES: DNA-directed RNA polymerase [Metallosphaera]|uniref:DNA-directed RNA polymerase subunit Rpo7 n=3 Tax=Metallosphaera TaxID=41980 RepID=A4YIX7_METS5|nr:MULTISPECIES: DNA-directed RNA polymerase [Metallosphaera]ABP96379.1 DNA-directed RNA polymerase, subunit E' [Metallosphaera sedula DSM 5348]AIM28362.1 DNA-directed RNA polymerase, subunit E' [Metallosphaera sedula]AKV75157.1 DNA-directed RNA polymerase subunit E' [Metallosphaera sedula]AKV77394.1 DNA-directed RNA polymerase subunit E' [Metallosphaera sedula]AKV79646.1 DNA-directed RNA polymerase subunit E' [Metallosphaera sedula]
MFKVVKARGVVRIPPELFGEPLNKTAIEILNNEYKERLFKDLGLVLSVIRADVNEEGMIIFGDGATYHEVEFELLTFSPMIQEVIEGDITQVDNYGIYVNMGPMDGLVHVSQIGDDNYKFDSVRGILIGEKSKKTFQKGDMVRARIMTISSTASNRLPRIGLTMRQMGLGKVERRN